MYIVLLGVVGPPRQGKIHSGSKPALLALADKRASQVPPEHALDYRIRIPPLPVLAATSAKIAWEG